MYYLACEMAVMLGFFVLFLIEKKKFLFIHSLWTIDTNSLSVVYIANIPIYINCVFMFFGVFIYELYFNTGKIIIIFSFYNQ